MGQGLGLVAVVVLAATSACTDTLVEDPQDASSGDDGGELVAVEPDADAVDVRTASFVSDAEIAGVVVAAHRAGAREGEAASGGATGAAVRELATRLETEHGVAGMRDLALFVSLKVTPRDSAMSLALTDESAARLAALKAAAGGSFDATYLQQQVSAHAELLGLLDYTMIPSAGNQSLRAELMNIRDMEGSHLALALEQRAPAR